MDPRGGLSLNTATPVKNKTHTHKKKHSPHSPTYLALKGHNVVLGEDIQTQNFNIYSINEVIIQTRKCLC